MLHSKLPLLAVSFCLTSTLSLWTDSSANAGLIVHEYRSISSGNAIDTNDYLGSWNALDSNIVSRDLNQFTKQRSGNRRMNHLAIDLSFDSGFADFSFEAGLDAGFGAALYLNGSEIGSNGTDLWWGYNWSHEDVFKTDVFGLNAGSNVLDFYWGEWCCNGGSSIRFSVNGSDWMDLTVDNIESSTQSISVPEPALIPLVAVGIAGMVLLRLRTSSKATSG